MTPKAESDNVCVTWHSGRVPEVFVQELAELFVTVDLCFGEEPWWFDVRKGGVPAAENHIRLHWMGFVVSTTADGKVIGFGALGQPVEGSVEISRVMVHPSKQGAGVGRRILEMLREKVTEMGFSPWVDVLESSTRAIVIYEKMGFTTVSYQYGRDSGRLARQMRYNAPAPPTRKREAESFTQAETT